MYKCREVQCPRCEHIFMWLQNADTLNKSYVIYRVKGMQEDFTTTFFPKCSCEMVISNSLLTGIDIENEMVEKVATCRGI